MSKRLFLLVALMIAVMFGISIAAEFSADMVSVSKGQTMNSKVNFGTDKWRSEFQKEGTKMITIVRADKNVVWMVMPAQNSYMEMALTNEHKMGMTKKAPGEISRKKLGAETVNGMVCDKYEVTYTNKEGTTKMYQWLSTRDMIPVKSQAADGSWSMEMKNIKTGKQPISLFSVPAGYSKMSLPGMGMTGANSGNKTPSSPKDVKNMLKGKVPGF